MAAGGAFWRGAPSFSSPLRERVPVRGDIRSRKRCARAICERSLSAKQRSIQVETMDDLVRKVPWPGEDPESEPLLSREWLVTNGLGGYASGTVNGVITRG